MRDVGARRSATPHHRPGCRRALVAFEGSSSDSEQVADAIAEALEPDLEVVLADISDTDPATCTDYDLVITGSASHSLRLQWRPGGSDAGSVREWLGRVPTAHGERYCACFDTAAAGGPAAVDPASARTARVLLERGYRVLSRQTFYLSTSGGTVRPDELRRAIAWARTVVGRIPPPG